MYDLPPKVDKIVIMDDHKNRLEPHIVFLQHDISREMREILLQEGITFQEFIKRSCIEYINQKQREKIDEYNYVNFSEMQFPNIPKEHLSKWYYGNIELNKSISQEEPLVTYKEKRKSKDKKKLGHF